VILLTGYFVKILRAPASGLNQMVNLSFHFSARQASEINKSEMLKLFYGVPSFCGSCDSINGGTASNSFEVPNHLSQKKIKICPWFLSIYLYWHDVPDDGTGTMIFSNSHFFDMFCVVPEL
jgi:hypothetical protein